MRFRALTILIGEREAGTLYPVFSGKAGRLPSFFQNLLQEGLLRQQLASLRGCNPDDH